MIVQNIFSPKASRIIRVLLIHPDYNWSVLGLSREAGVAYGYTYRVVKTLMKIGLCRKTEYNRIAVINPGELLSRWASFFNFTLMNDVVAYYSPQRDLGEFIHNLTLLSEYKVNYALTLHSGAMLVAPYVRPVNVYIYVKKEEIENVERILKLQPIELGGNVFLVKPYDEGVFYGVQSIEGIYVVSNIQLYVDLYNYPARGREAAEYLRKKVIGF